MSLRWLSDSGESILAFEGRMSESDRFSDAFVIRSLDSAVHDESIRDSYRKLISRADRALDEAGESGEERRAWVVPGRIEVLGKHVDYAGGRSLLCCVDRALVIVARLRKDRELVLYDAERNERIALPIDGSVRGTLPWSVYPRTVLQRLASNFGSPDCGIEIAIASNLPSAAGVSSSSALTLGLLLSMVSLWKIDQSSAWRDVITDRLALAGYAGAIENGNDFRTLPGRRGVGTEGGAQDQTAILCCSTGQLDVFGWMPVTHEQAVVWPSDYRFVIAVSGVLAAKAGRVRERYNRVSRTAQRIVDSWNNFTGASARTLREVIETPGAMTTRGECSGMLQDVLKGAGDKEFSADHLLARVDQFAREVQVLIPEAVEALKSGDLAAFGRCVDESQHGAERALENQVSETVHLQRLARSLGATAASAFGAGFGGSVWAMIPASQADAFMARWRERYTRSHPNAAKRAHFFVTGPGPAAFEVASRP